VALLELDHAPQELREALDLGVGEVVETSIAA
jgi:hypothetical protein